MTEQEVQSVYTGQYLRDLTDNSIFKVLCNCGSSSPRRHTIRFVQFNPEKFDFVEPKDLAAHLGVPYNSEN